MLVFQKQAEASLEQAGTGLVVRALPPGIARGDWVSTMAICSTAARAAMTVMFVVFGLLTSGA